MFICIHLKKRQNFKKKNRECVLIKTIDNKIYKFELVLSYMIFIDIIIVSILYRYYIRYYNKYNILYYNYIIIIILYYIIIIL